MAVQVERPGGGVMDEHLNREDERDDALHDWSSAEISYAISEMDRHASKANNQALYRALELIQFCVAYGEPPVARYAEATLVSLMTARMKGAI